MERNNNTNTIICNPYIICKSGLIGTNSNLNNWYGCANLHRIINNNRKMLSTSVRNVEVNIILSKSNVQYGDMINDHICYFVCKYVKCTSYFSQLLFVE